VPRIVVTQGAAAGLVRCREFLRLKSPAAAKRAASAIQECFGQLAVRPEMGRPLGDELQLRERLIEFGDSGYVALYRYSKTDDTVYILAFRHQKEAGY